MCCTGSSVYYNPVAVGVRSLPAHSVTFALVQQVSITLIATGFGSGVVEAALRPAARRQPQQQQQQQQQHPSPRQVPVERWAVSYTLLSFVLLGGMAFLTWG